MRGSWPALWPVLAALLLAATIGAAVGHSVYQIPNQRGDVLEPLMRANVESSMPQLFVRSLHVAANTLRPLRFVQTRWLVQLADNAGASYHAVFRGVHAGLAIALIVMFACVCRVGSWVDLAAFGIPLLVVVGMPTLAAILREAYPVNHYAEIVLFVLAVMPIATRPPAWWTQAVALVLLAYALLLLESGVLVWVAMLAALAVGLPGITRKTVIAATAMLVGYFLLRAALGLYNPAIGDHGSGYGTRFYSGSELLARFGESSLWLRTYNTACGILGVLFSQPRRGVWPTGELHPVVIVNLLSSTLTTLVIGWYLIWRLPRSRAAWTWHDRMMLIAVVLIAANGVLASAYIKDEILSVAGVFYGIAAYVAIRGILSDSLWGESLSLDFARDNPEPVEGLRLASRTRTIKVRATCALVSVLLFGIASGWAMRSAGLHFQLRTAAFKMRNEWATVLPPGDRASWPMDPDALALTQRMRTEAIQRRVANLHFLPHWGERWWIE